MIYLYSLLTILVFTIALKINQRLNLVWLNTFIISLLLLIPILLISNIDYDRYMLGNAPLNNLLGLSVVALALPLYEQLPQIRENWREILIISTAASIFSMVTGALLAIILGANAEITATILSKSVTTPIAMAISENLGGIPSIAAVGVVIAGLQGSLFGYVLLKKLGIKHYQAIGLAIGAASHVLGTVGCMEIDKKAASYSSLSLVLSGILSAIFAPLAFSILSNFIAH